MGSKRLNYIDMSKGIAILLVVFGHISQVTDNMKILIYAFHMPIFFIISGLMMKHTVIGNKNFLYNLKHKVKTILIPYVSFEFVYTILRMFTKGFTLNNFIERFVKESLMLKPQIISLWFLIALFVAQIIFMLYLKLNKNVNYFIAICLVFSFIYVFHIKTENIYLLIIGQSLLGMSFLSIGYGCYDLIINKDISIKYIIMFFILYFLFSIKNGFVDMRNLVYGNNFILYILNGVLGSVLLVSITKLCNSKFLSYFGKNSIIILGTHNIIIMILNEIIGLSLFNYKDYIITFLIVILIEIPIIEIINRYLPFMIGKFKKKEKVQVISD